MEDNILTDLKDYHVAILGSHSSAYHSTALYFPLISCLFLFFVKIKPQENVWNWNNNIVFFPKT